MSRKRNSASSPSEFVLGRDWIVRQRLLRLREDIATTDDLDATLRGLRRVWGLEEVDGILHDLEATGRLTRTASGRVDIPPAAAWENPDAPTRGRR